MNRKVPSFLKDLLANPPQAGTGVHNWLFRVARQLHAHLPAAEIVLLLESRVAHCGRRVPRLEIVKAVMDSLSCAWQPGGDPATKHTTSLSTTSRWPKVNEAIRAAILRDGFDLAALWELGKPRIENNERHTEALIDHLFPGNPLLCCGLSASVFDTRPREAWRGELERLALIVPSPMSAYMGKTKDGRDSKHTLANTGPRRFLVCEFDTGTADQHAALLRHLAACAPLVCVVHSGGKSLHGWFYAHGHPEDKVEKFFRYAVSLGADPATWTRSQFVRIPDGTRDSGKRQTVYYLNDNILKNEPRK